VHEMQRCMAQLSQSPYTHGPVMARPALVVSANARVLRDTYVVVQRQLLRRPPWPLSVRLSIVWSPPDAVRP
jgi:hypothetical protein